MAEVTETAPDVLSFSTLDESIRQLVEQVQTTKCLVIIARDGKAMAVLVEAQEYELHLRKLALMDRIIYDPTVDRVEILTVVHGSRDLPSPPPFSGG